MWGGEGKRGKYTSGSNKEPAPSKWLRRWGFYNEFRSALIGQLSLYCYNLKGATQRKESRGGDEGHRNPGDGEDKEMTSSQFLLTARASGGRRADNVAVQLQLLAYSSTHSHCRLNHLFIIWIGRKPCPGNPTLYFRTNIPPHYCISGSPMNEWMTCCPTILITSKGRPPLSDSW